MSPTRSLLPHLYKSIPTKRYLHMHKGMTHKILMKDVRPNDKFTVFHVCGKDTRKMVGAQKRLVLNSLQHIDAPLARLSVHFDLYIFQRQLLHLRTKATVFKGTHT